MRGLDLAHGIADKRRRLRNLYIFTASAAAAQQKVLEHVFGGAAARTLISQAKERLYEALHGVLHADGARFYDLTGRAGADAESASTLRRLADDVERKARELDG